jgi:transposase-like protein
MANRIRLLDEKVQSVETVLEQINVEAAAREAGVPASTLRYDLNKVKEALPDILVNQKPGPQTEAPAEQAAAKLNLAEDRLVCPECGGKAVKNGTYWILNWLLMLTMGWLGVHKVLIQRWRCPHCRQEIASPERVRQAEARRAWWEQVARLVGLSRFKLALSVRRTQLLVGFVYARQVSVGYIERLTQRVGQRAQAVLTKLSACRQKVARFLMFDETFPKMKQRAYSWGVAICEHGLIRSVRCITRKAKDIPAQLRQVVGGIFTPPIS